MSKMYTFEQYKKHQNANAEYQDWKEREFYPRLAELKKLADVSAIEALCAEDDSRDPGVSFALHDWLNGQSDVYFTQSEVKSGAHEKIRQSVKNERAALVEEWDKRI